MPSWNWRMIASLFGGTPGRLRIVHSRSRLAESCALGKSMKHAYRGVPFFLASAWSRQATNIMSSVERAGRKPLFSSEQDVRKMPP